MTRRSRMHRTTQLYVCVLRKHGHEREIAFERSSTGESWEHPARCQFRSQVQKRCFSTNCDCCPANEILEVFMLHSNALNPHWNEPMCRATSSSRKRFKKLSHAMKF